MKVKRNVTIDTEMFEVGDVIKFKLTDGEKVKAKAVKETPEGMLFVFVDCLAKEYPMFKDIDDMDEDEEDITYMNSDLRKALNGEILARFPDEIRSLMVAVNAEGDLLRIPSEREIFGKNLFGQVEYKKVKQWKSMKKCRNRIALQGEDEISDMYWVTNCHQKYHSLFINVCSDGSATYSRATYTSAVRPVFCLTHYPI